ncbi:hypothetical protein ACFQO7_32110 [Catellatospora aurea]|uniref:DUF4386 family protein n=1 Tax=Catellatospora aurea TaxID=1337874 RepID=A0ABW2H5E4_9ACTN
MTERHEATAILAEVRQLRQRARNRAHSGVWFPVLVLAGLLLASILLYRHPFGMQAAGGARYLAGLPHESHSMLLTCVFWFLGLPVAFALIARRYAAHSERVGMRINWRWFAVAGLAVLTVQAVAAVTVGGEPGRDQLTTGDDGLNIAGWLLTPLSPVAVAVAVLGWVERRWSLTVTGFWIAALTGYHLSAGLSQVTLLGLGRPGPNLLLMAAPLLVLAAVHVLRSSAQGGSGPDAATVEVETR